MAKRARAGAEAERRVSRRLLAFVVTLVTLQTANNLLPYLGLRDDSCQTMFSGLDWTADANNHLFMPQRAVSDVWTYHRDVEVTLEPTPELHTREAYLRDWLSQEDRLLNTEATRAVIRQLCDAGYRVTLSIEGERYDDACEVPRLSSPMWWVPVRLYETDLPEDDPREDDPPEGDLPEGAP